MKNRMGKWYLQKSLNILTARRLCLGGVLKLGLNFRDAERSTERFLARSACLSLVKIIFISLWACVLAFLFLFPHPWLELNGYAARLAHVVIALILVLSYEMQKEFLSRPRIVVSEKKPQFLRNWSVIALAGMLFPEWTILTFSVFATLALMVFTGALLLMVWSASIVVIDWMLSWLAGHDFSNGDFDSWKAALMGRIRATEIGERDIRLRSNTPLNEPTARPPWSL